MRAIGFDIFESNQRPNRTIVLATDLAPGSRELHDRWWNWKVEYLGSYVAGDSQFSGKTEPTISKK